MINIEEQKGHNWYVFLIIGLLIGDVLGYYASEKGLLGQKAVGRPMYAQCIRAVTEICNRDYDDPITWRACIKTAYEACDALS